MSRIIFLCDLVNGIAETRSAKPSTYPGRDSLDRYAALVNGKDKKTGPAILLKVMAGDRLQIRSDSWYENLGEKKKASLPAAEAALTLLTGMGDITAKSVQGMTGTIHPLLPAITSFLRTRSDEENKMRLPPKAYLNWILLDEQLNPVTDSSIESSGFIRVGSPGELKTLLKEDWQIRKGGYVYIYTSNDSPTDVYFDNFSVTSISGPLLETAHYYPFGLLIHNISSRAIGKISNQYLYNGKELQQKEFINGSGLEWYDYGARMYDAQIGRWNQVDPLASAFPYISPYAAFNNNPLRFLDPTGAAPEDWIEKGGKMLYDNRVKNQSDAITLYGKGAIYRPNGYNYTASDGSNIELGDYGFFKQNGQIKSSPDLAQNSLAYTNPTQSVADAQSQIAGIRGSYKASIAVTGFISTDAAIPDPTDAAWPKWKAK